MNILFAYYRYAPHSNGPSIYIELTRWELEREGHVVDLFTHDKGWTLLQIDGKASIDKMDVKKEAIERARSRYDASYSSWIYWREMERYSIELASMKMDLAGYDLIHCHDFMTARALSRVKPPHIPLVVSIHNCKYREAVLSGDYGTRSLQEQLFIQKEEYIGAESADAVIVACDWLKDELIGIGVNQKRIHKIPYAVSEDRFSNRQAVPPVTSKPLILLCPARLVTIKGHSYLLEALHEIRLERDDFVCVMAGEGPLLDELLRMTVALGLESVVAFLGKRGDMPDLMNNSDIIVLPSLHDTFPLVLMEGQWSVRPVVATDVGGVREIVTDGLDGLIVPPGNSAALAVKLRELLDDKELRQRLGEYGRLKAEQSWRVDHHIQGIKRIYENTTAGAADTIERLPNNLWQLDEPLLNLIGISDSPIREVSLKGVLPPELLSELVSEFRDKPHYIHLLDASGVVLQTSPVGMDGAYSFRPIPIGKYVLRSTLLNFGTKAITLS
ncbi:glycosyltransferase family 4 protein [Cohnella silvisoli]|uniref:Glycosyltransferase family 4 protein n=1 Tax=Cohnella silvisoli TaxID=2873699 RepID=A0ABV1L2R9_9BACL|nr:glycosyltransferase family 4 protein [Cohnella silvisoli]